MNKKFEAKVREMIATADRSQCWPYWLTINHRGYGSVWVTHPDGRQTNRIAHRYAYEIMSGTEVPKDLVCDHLCRNPACVNPFHLEVVTQRENLRRGIGTPCSRSDAATCPNGHAMTGSNVRMAKPCPSRPWPNRQCVVCCREATRRHRAKKKMMDRQG